KRVLFICIHNSARSQIAEALMRRQCGEDVQVESAGLTPGKLNPLVVEVLKEEGIDISGKATRNVFEVYKAGKLFSDVITVCDQASAERCPIFPGALRRLHWSFADPSTFEGTWEEKLELTRQVRDEIQEKINQWCDAYCDVPSVPA